MKTAHLLLLTWALALTACASLQTQHQKIAAACVGVTAAGEAIADAADAGKVSKADAAKAAALYHKTDAYCEPAPRESLSANDYADLLGVAAELATLKGAVK